MDFLTDVEKRLQKASSMKTSTVSPLSDSVAAKCSDRATRIALGWVELTLFMLAIITVLFLVTIFFGGQVAEIKAQAIERGHAQYNPKTGEWQWLEKKVDRFDSLILEPIPVIPSAREPIQDSRSNKKNDMVIR